MRKLLAIALLCAAMTAAQEPSSHFQRGTIMSVKPHPGSTSNDSSSELYDIDLRIGNTTYTVLFTQEPGKHGIQYRAGLDLFVKVNEKTISYNDILGQTKEAPILSRHPAQERNNTGVPEQNKR